VGHMLKTIKWDQTTVSDFIGHYLTEPKPHVLFEPQAAIDIDTFAALLGKNRLLLDLRSQMLSYQSQFYLNGEHLPVNKTLTTYMQTLADERSLDTSSINHEALMQLAQTLHAAYLAGYIRFDIGVTATNER